MQFEIKGVVVAKGRPRFTKRGHTYTPKKTKDYETLVKMTARQRFKEPLEEALGVEITIHKTPPKSWSKKKRKQAIEGQLLPVVKPDIDNYTKSILDGCNGIAFKDDNQIVDLRVIKTYSEEDKAVVKIKEL